MYCYIYFVVAIYVYSARLVLDQSRGGWGKGLFGLMEKKRKSLFHFLFRVQLPMDSL